MFFSRGGTTKAANRNAKAQGSLTATSDGESSDMETDDNGSELNRRGDSDEEELSVASKNRGGNKLNNRNRNDKARNGSGNRKRSPRDNDSEEFVDDDDDEGDDDDDGEDMSDDGEGSDSGSDDQF